MMRIRLGNNCTFGSYFMLNKRRTAVALALALAAFSSSAGAASLAARMPPKSLLYVQWNGAALTRGYKTSRLRAIARASGVHTNLAARVFKSLFPFNQSPASSRALIRLAMKHPGALAVVMKNDHRGGGRSAITLMALRAGKKSAKAFKLMRGITKDYATAKVPFETYLAYRAGGCVVLQESRRLRKPAFRIRSGTSPIVRLREQLGHSPIFFYANIHTAWRDSMSHEVPPQRILMRIMGGASVNALAGTLQFSGHDCLTRLILTFHKKPSGLLASCVQPTSAAALNLVPRHAVSFASTSVNVSKDFTALAAWFLLGRSSSGQGQPAQPNPRAVEHKIQAMVLQQFHVHLRRSLLEPLSGTWVAYQLAGPGGALQDPVFVHPLKSPQALGGAISSIAIKLNQLWKSQGRPMNIAMTNNGATRLYTMKLGRFSPTLAIAHNSLYLCPSDRAALAAAMRRAGGAGVAANPSFTALKNRLHVPSGVHAAYSFARTKPLLKVILSIFKQQIQPRLRAANIMPPHLHIPSFARLAPHLSPTASASWFDDDAYHVTWLGPIPAAQLLMAPAWAAGPTGKMLPSLLTATVVRAHHK